MRKHVETLPSDPEPDDGNDSDLAENEAPEADTREPLRECAHCGETLELRHEPHFTMELETMLREYQDDDGTMAYEDRKALEEAICDRMTIEKELINESLEESSTYPVQYRVGALTRFINQEFMAQVRAYVADPLLAPVWEYIRHNRSRLEAGLDVDDARHLGGG